MTHFIASGSHYALRTLAEKYAKGAVLGLKRGLSKFAKSVGALPLWPPVLASISEPMALHFAIWFL